jgi:hypothetical protein
MQQYRRHSGNCARNGRLRFPCYLLTVSLLRPKSFPVNFDNEFRLKPAWLLRLPVMPSSFGAQIFGFPCIFPCYPEFAAETGSRQTASSATQSCLLNSSFPRRRVVAT